MPKAPPADRRRPGRPRALEAHSSVSVWVTASVHEALIQRAKAADRSVSATVRELLKIRIAD